MVVSRAVKITMMKYARLSGRSSVHAGTARSVGTRTAIGRSPKLRNRPHPQERVPSRPAASRNLGRRRIRRDRPHPHQVGPIQAARAGSRNLGRRRIRRSPPPPSSGSHPARSGSFAKFGSAATSTGSTHPLKRGPIQAARVGSRNVGRRTPGRGPQNSPEAGVGVPRRREHNFVSRSSCRAGRPANCSGRPPRHRRLLRRRSVVSAATRRIRRRARPVAPVALAALGDSAALRTPHRYFPCP